VNLKDVVSLLPDKLTGADLYSVCSYAWCTALKTQIHSLTHGMYSDNVRRLFRVCHFPVFSSLVILQLLVVLHISHDYVAFTV